MRPASLADIVASLLDEFQVPVPTATIRVLASARRGDAPVAAEALSRLAAAQREAHARVQGRAPRLCHALDDRGRALSPRVWARGDWRLARRVISRDVMPSWRAQLAYKLCCEMTAPGASEEVGRMALAAVGQILGPVATYLPRTSAEWERWAGEVARRLPAAGVTTLTSQQYAVEQWLLSHQPPLPAEGLYFGLRDDQDLGPDERDPALVRLPEEGEQGEPFDVILQRRLAGDNRAVREVAAYLQGFSHVMDEIGRAPTSREFAEYWRFSPDSVRDDEAAFTRAFPEEPGPERLLRLLDRALPRNGAMAWLLGVRVVDDAAVPRAQFQPSPGQRWRRRDGSEEITIVRADTDTFVARSAEAAELRVARVAELADWVMVLPEDLWWVRFDLVRMPHDLLDRLLGPEVVLERLSRPANPRPHRVAFGGATVEAHVTGVDENDVRAKVRAALGAQAEIDEQTFLIERLDARSST